MNDKTISLGQCEENCMVGVAQPRREDQQPIQGKLTLYLDLALALFDTNWYADPLPCNFSWEEGVGDEKELLIIVDGDSCHGKRVPKFIVRQRRLMSSFIILSGGRLSDRTLKLSETEIDPCTVRMLYRKPPRGCVTRDPPKEKRLKSLRALARVDPN